MPVLLRRGERLVSVGNVPGDSPRSSILFCDSELMTQAARVLSANCMEGFEFLPTNKKISSGTLHFGARQ